MKRRLTSVFAFLLVVCVLLSGCAGQPSASQPSSGMGGDIPQFSDKPFYIVNDNKPSFTDKEITDVSFEKYSDLDSLGRCGVATACIGIDIMPTEERGAIGQIKPSGWHTVKYDIVDGKYLYNRCHLIGFQLAGENANDKNLITGTRYFNVEGMLPFENMVADYVKETKNHVMYRVTPVYEDNELVARGVYMEAYSVEDKGDGICFNVFVYNNQPGIVINYATGESRLDDGSENNEGDKPSSVSKDGEYVLNKNSKKFHKSDCSGIEDMNPENKQEYKGDRESLINDGYAPCKICNP